MESESMELSPRARAKRDQIREAAQELFLGRGFAASSTDAIAAAAGVSKETLYRYYPRKEDLFADVIRQLTLGTPRQPFAPLDDAVIHTTADVHRILTLTAERIAGAMMQPSYIALLRVTIAEAPRFPELSDVVRQAVPEQALAAVADFLVRAQDRGVIDLADPESAARLFIGPLLTYLMLDGLLRTGEPRPPAPDRLRRHVDLLLRAISG